MNNQSLRQTIREYIIDTKMSKQMVKAILNVSTQTINKALAK